MKKNQQLHTSVVFDIDSASVAVSLLSYQRGNTIPEHEIFTKRIILEQFNIEDFFAETLRAIDLLGMEAIQKSPSPVESIYVVVGAPWATSQKKIIHYERLHDFVLTSEIVEEALAKEDSDSLSRNLDFHNFENLQVFERVTTNIHVQGYPSLHPYEVKTKIKNFDVHRLVSVISSSSYQAITDTIERVFQREPIFVSNTLISWMTIQKYFPHLQDTFVLDIGGTNTQVYLIEQDHLKEIAVFPVGMSHILQELTERLAVGKQEARSLLKLYTQSALEPEYQQKISKVMKEVFTIWYKKLFEVTDQLSKKKLLPSTWTFIAPRDIESWLSFHLLQEDGLSTHIKTRSSVELINISSALNSISKEKGFGHIQDTEMVPIADVIGTYIFKD
jgi:hypothetical protein